MEFLIRLEIAIVSVVFGITATYLIISAFHFFWKALRWAITGLWND